MFIAVYIASHYTFRVYVQLLLRRRLTAVMNRMVTFALFLGIVLLGYVDSQNTVGDVQLTVKTAQEIAAIAKTMQADIGSKGKSYQHMSEIVNKVAIVVSNTDTDGKKSLVRQSSGLSFGLNLAGGIVSGIGGALSAAGKSFGS